MKNRDTVSGPDFYNPERRRWLHRGVNDVLAGLPYPPDYETADKFCQCTYENGRLNAAKIKAAGLSLAPITQAEFGQQDVPRLHQVEGLARMIVGNVLPEGTRREYLAAGGEP